jgi:hypothetical protein
MTADRENPCLKIVDMCNASLDARVVDAQADRIVITRGGNPLAIVVWVAARDSAVRFQHFSC